MLTNDHITIIKSTVPILESGGPAIAAHFYNRMFEHNPELKDIFNMAHQRSGGQPAALFDSLAAYAKNIDNVAVLAAAVERIAQKHTSFSIQPEHYPIVGHHLIETLRELVGEAFTPDIEEAWTAAYTFLADIFINREKELYSEQKHELGGWNGLREFKIIEKNAESERVTSFVFEPVDGQAVMAYKPGQYLGINLLPIGAQYHEIRQYSLSQASNGKNYRISVKREGDGETKGLASNCLHQELSVGDTVNLAAPAGDFFYQEKSAPVVLISAGVGLTPMQSMLQHLGQQAKKELTYIHACQNEAQHSFQQETAELIEANNWKQFTWYMEGQGTHQGHLNLHDIATNLPTEKGDFYLCGPIVFMQHTVEQLTQLGVTADRMHYEVFGPHKGL